MRFHWYRSLSLLCLGDAVLIQTRSGEPDLVSPIAEAPLNWVVRRPSQVVRRHAHETNATPCSDAQRFPYHDHQEFYNASFEQHYCLNESDFASLPIIGDYRKLTKVYDRLSAGSTVRILVLGGSMTAGVRCAQSLQGDLEVTGKPCAWPARLHASLASRFPAATVEMLNLAQGGTTTSVILAGIGMVLRGMQDEGLTVDAVIIDTLVNDAVEAKHWDDSSNMSFSAERMVSLSYEALVRALHELVPNAAVLSFLSACPKCHGMKDSQQNVSTFYDLPRVDYASFQNEHQDLVDLWKQVGNDRNHPTWETHQMIADVLANVWGRAWAGSCGQITSVYEEQQFPEQTYEKQEDLELFQPCLNVLSGYSARQALDGSGPQPNITNGWRLFEDRPGKPGWIAESKGGTINFNLRFGPRPRLAVVFLRSYEDMGSAKLHLNTRETRLSGLWSSDLKLNVSQSYVAWYNAGAKGEQYGAPGFDIRSQAELDLVVTSLGGKFKILQVMSC